MAKAITTIRQSLNYQSQHADYLAANHALFNRVVAFYFEVIQAHENLLDLATKQALTALETLTHATSKNRTPVMPLTAIAQDVPAMFRRAAINAALGSARSFYTALKKWRTRREKAEAKKARKGKREKFTERPPVPPRTWNKSVPFYAGQWKERTDSSILLKVWTGSCWSWIKVRTFGRGLPDGVEMGSPSLVRHGKQWWLHTPLENGATKKAAAQISALLLSSGRRDWLWDVVEPARVNDHDVGRKPVIVVGNGIVNPIAVVVDVRLRELHASKHQTGRRLGQFLARLHLLHLHASGAYADDLAIVDFCEDVDLARRVDLMFAVLLDLVAKQSFPIKVVFLFGECDTRGTDGGR